MSVHWLHRRPSALEIVTVAAGTLFLTLKLIGSHTGYMTALRMEIELLQLAPASHSCPLPSHWVLHICSE
jgi:hypothetical protein